MLTWGYHIVPTVPGRKTILNTGEKLVVIMLVMLLLLGYYTGSLTKYHGRMVTMVNSTG